jgi:hypothetical protein
MMIIIAAPTAANKTASTGKPQLTRPGAIPNGAPGATKMPMNATSTATAAVTADIHAALIRVERSLET